MYWLNEPTLNRSRATLRDLLLTKPLYKVQFSWLRLSNSIQSISNWMSNCSPLFPIWKAFFKWNAIEWTGAQSAIELKSKQNKSKMFYFKQTSSQCLLIKVRFSEMERPHPMIRCTFQLFTINVANDMRLEMDREQNVCSTLNASLSLMSRRVSLSTFVRGNMGPNT